MPAFPHLGLTKKIDGLYKTKQGGGPRPIDPITQANLDGRGTHGGSLLGSIDRLSQLWTDNIRTRAEEHLPELPNPEILPVFLQIDTQKCDVESLKSFGIEIIAEEEGGFIIGASSGDFISLRKKIQKFMDEEGSYKNKASQLWQINDGVQWRIEQILSEDLREKWDTIRDDEDLVVDVGIACHMRSSPQPKKKKDETDAELQQRLVAWRVKKEAIEIHRDEQALKRQTDFEGFVTAHTGEILSNYIDFDDSFSCRIKISGKGLKDIVLNYQFLFEVVSSDPLVLADTTTSVNDAVAPTLIAPQEGFPKVCVSQSERRKFCLVT